MHIFEVLFTHVIVGKVPFKNLPDCFHNLINIIALLMYHTIIYNPISLSHQI